MDRQTDFVLYSMDTSKYSCSVIFFIVIYLFLSHRGTGGLWSQNYLTRGYVLHKNISHGRTCLPVGHVLWENVCWRTCLTGGMF